nr:hypothetical protein [Tanacetum cinerariifolium]
MEAKNLIEEPNLKNRDNPRIKSSQPHNKISLCNHVIPKANPNNRHNRTMMRDPRQRERERERERRRDVCECDTSSLCVNERDEMRCVVGSLRMLMLEEEFCWLAVKAFVKPRDCGFDGCPVILLEGFPKMSSGHGMSCVEKELRMHTDTRILLVGQPRPGCSCSQCGSFVTFEPTQIVTAYLSLPRTKSVHCVQRCHGATLFF